MLSIGLFPICLSFWPFQQAAAMSSSPYPRTATTEKSVSSTLQSLEPTHGLSRSVRLLLLAHPALQPSPLQAQKPPGGREGHLDNWGWWLGWLHSLLVPQGTMQRWTAGWGGKISLSAALQSQSCLPARCPRSSSHRWLCSSEWGGKRRAGKDPSG